MVRKRGPAAHDINRPDAPNMSSDRSFGFVFAGFAALVATFMLWRMQIAFWGWLAAAGFFALLSVFLPRALHPLNVLWFKFGLLLHHIVTPVMLALMYFLVFTPMGMLMRLLNRRPLNLRFERNTQSYWIARTPPGPPPASFDNQF